MSVLTSTLALYRDSASDALKDLARGLWGVIALVVAYAVLTVTAMLMAPLGLVGGFVVGFVQAGVIGWYLAIVAIGVRGRRRVVPDDLRHHVGSLFIEVISVLFIFFIASLLLMGAGPQVQLVAVAVATVVFNPIPEMVYQEDEQSLALLGRALSFMQQNWPEWLGGQLLGAAFLTVWAWFMFGGLAPSVVITLLQAFGPFFGFISSGGMLLLSPDPLSLLGNAVLIAFTHAFLLYRGHLYRRLSRSSRRGRAWQNRIR